MLHASLSSPWRPNLRKGVLFCLMRLQPGGIWGHRQIYSQKIGTETLKTEIIDFESNSNHPTIPEEIAIKWKRQKKNSYKVITWASLMFEFTINKLFTSNFPPPTTTQAFESYLYGNVYLIERLCVHNALLHSALVKMLSLYKQTEGETVRCWKEDYYMEHTTWVIRGQTRKTDFTCANFRIHTWSFTLNVWCTLAYFDKVDDFWPMQVCLPWDLDTFPQK